MTSESAAVAGSALTKWSAGVAGSAATFGSVAVAGSAATALSAGVAGARVPAPAWAAPRARAARLRGLHGCVNCVGCIGCVGLENEVGKVGRLADTPSLGARRPTSAWTWGAPRSPPASWRRRAGRRVRAAHRPLGRRRPAGRDRGGGRRLIERHGQPAGIGVGLPSQIDFAAGVVVSSVNIPLEGVPVRQVLEQRFGVPVVVDNDANCAALAEAAVQQVDHLVMLTLGTGVGGGVVLDGKIFRGAHGLGGELGHFPIQADGPQCPGNCPGRGCLEALCSGTALERDATEAGKNAPGLGAGRALRRRRPRVGAARRWRPRSAATPRPRAVRPPGPQPRRGHRGLREHLPAGARGHRRRALAGLRAVLRSRGGGGRARARCPSCGSGRRSRWPQGGARPG